MYLMGGMENKTTFDEWMLAVDAAVWHLTEGLSVYDLPDVCFMDWYEGGTSPVTAAKRAVRNVSE
jgi:hypothetical protein